MRNLLEDAIVGDVFNIPLSSASVFMVGLRDFPSVFEEPRLTKQAARGIFKLAAIIKRARDPQSAEEAAARAAMTDPDVQAGLDYQQATAERDQLEQQLQQAQQQMQQMQQAMQASDQRAMQVEQQGQELQQQNAQLQQQAMQEQQGRQAASMHAMQATDASIASQAAHQQQRMALASEVDQMALRLKQLVSTDPAAQQQTQNAAMAAQGAAGGASPPNVPQQPVSPDQAAMQQGAPPDAAQAEQVKQGSAGEQKEITLLSPAPDAAERIALGLKIGLPIVGALGGGFIGHSLGGGPSRTRMQHAVTTALGALAGASYARAQANKIIIRKKVRDLLEQHAEQVKQGSAGHLLGGPHVPLQTRIHHAATTALDALERTQANIDRKKVRDLLKNREAMTKKSAADYSVGFHKLMNRVRFEKAAAAPIWKALGVTAGGAAVGAPIGAALAAVGNRDPSVPSELESQLAASLQTAMKQKPSYLNKLRIASLMRDYNIERAGREHPGGEIARRAVQGAIAGAIGAPAALYGGKRLLQLIKKNPAAVASTTK